MPIYLSELNEENHLNSSVRKKFKQHEPDDFSLPPIDEFTVLVFIVGMAFGAFMISVLYSYSFKTM